MSQVKDEKLWKKIKNKWHYGDKGGVPGQWNARKAQLAVQEYKRLGGKYKTARPSKNNSLKKWTEEDWGYIDGKKGNRYLPKTIRDNLTPKEKKLENKLKRKATKSGEQYAGYSPSVAKKLSSLIA